jgi:hypothetical protein
MLKERGRVKQVVGNTDFTLTADAGESFRVRAVRIADPVSAYASILVDKVLCGYIRVSGTQGNHAPFPLGGIGKLGLYDWLIKEGIFRPIPIAKGQTFQITGVKQATSFVQIIYDVYDENDVRANEVNGSLANEYDLLQYGEYSTTIPAGSVQYQTQLTSNQYPAFPFGKVVPSKTTMILRAMAFSDVGKDGTAGTNVQVTQYVRLVRNRETLFDEDRNGFQYYGVAPGAGLTVIGAGHSLAGGHVVEDGREIYLFEPALNFAEGEDLDVYLQTVLLAGAEIFTAADANLCLVFNVRRA